MNQNRKSLAQLKRDAKSRTVYMECVNHFGSTGDAIPERLRGPRPLYDANSRALFFVNADGSLSELQIYRAALVDYTSQGLTVYRIGNRPLTEAEQKAYDEWQAIASTDEYKRQAEIDCLSDGTQTYWQQVRFYEERDMRYMMGCGIDKYGKEYDFNTHTIRDKNVRGKVDIEYRICERECTPEQFAVMYCGM